LILPGRLCSMSMITVDLTEEERLACDEAKRVLTIQTDADLVRLGLFKVCHHAEVRTSATAFSPRKIQAPAGEPQQLELDFGEPRDYAGQ